MTRAGDGVRIAEAIRLIRASFLVSALTLLTSSHRLDCHKSSDANRRAAKDPKGGEPPRPDRGLRMTASGASFPFPLAPVGVG